MASIIKVDRNGRVTYDGMLSSFEKEEYDKVLEILKTEIPVIESDLAEEYGNSVEYKYYLGKILGDFLTRFDVSYYERRNFWDEIKILASSEERKRDEGKNSAKRSFYEQCWTLSTIDIETVKKLSWRQWQDLLDRGANREDVRIFSWIREYPKKIKEQEWREFEKALHMYLLEKDTSVFSDAELFLIFDQIMLMACIWEVHIKKFKITNPKSLKLKNKSFWSKRYYKSCFTKRREKRKEVNAEFYIDIFDEVMNSKK